MLELAPGRFSTTTGWPMFCETLEATRRVTPSAPPPGGKPTTQLIGLEGKFDCARAPIGAIAAAAATRKSRLLIRCSSSQVQFQHHGRMIRGPLPFARPDIDDARRAAFRKLRREQREVDPQPPAALECLQTIV